jgi:geranylgeranyl pyrophosphate synthase
MSVHPSCVCHFPPPPIQTLDLVRRSEGLRRAKELAQVQAEQAMEAALGLDPSTARDGLVKLAALVVSRRH